MAIVEESANSATHLRALAASMEQSVRSLVVKVDEDHPSEDSKKNGAMVPYRGNTNELPKISHSQWREL